MSWLKSSCRGFLARLGYEVYRRPVPMTLRHSLQGLLQARDVDYVIDVGALYGDFGNLLRDIGYRGHIISFEPMAETYRKLKRNIAHDEKWRAIPCAIGDCCGEQSLNVLGGDDLCSFAAPNELCAELFGERGRVQREVVVQVKTLESALADVSVSTEDHNVFLKLDTQGWDLKILQAAESIMSGFTAIQMEVSMQPIYRGAPCYFQSCEFLERHGFTLSALHPINATNLAILEADCLFVRSDRRRVDRAQPSVQIPVSRPAQAVVRATAMFPERSNPQ